MEIVNTISIDRNIIHTNPDDLLNLIGRHINAALGMFLFFCITFVGDHNIHGFPSFIIVWLVLIFYRLKILKINVWEVKLQIAMFVALTPYFLISISKPDFYDYSFVFIILYVNAFPLLFQILQRKASILHVKFFIVAFFILSLLTILSGDLRASIIFGPNVLYRIYGMLFILLFFITRKTTHIGQDFFYLILISLSLLATGSRGATIILGFILLLVIIFYLKKKSGMLLLIFTSVLATGVIILNIEILTKIFSRSFLFSIEHNIRMNQYAEFLDFLRNAEFYQLIFGVTNTNEYYKIYPHNIFLETVVYHGFYLFMLLFLLSLNSLYRFFTESDMRILILIFAPIILGTMVSGNYQDNYQVITLIFVLLVLRKKRIIYR